MTGASAAQRAIRAAREAPPGVRSLQELHREAPRTARELRTGRARA